MAARTISAPSDSQDDDLMFEMEGDRDEEGAEGKAQDIRKGSELDGDTLNAVLVWLVGKAIPDHYGVVQQQDLTGRLVQEAVWGLTCCSCVCKMWYVGTRNDELWRVLLWRRWGESSFRELTPAEMALSNRALYIRSVTTQVLVWGENGKRKEEDAPSAPRSPALLEPRGPLQEFGVRQVAAGVGFSCLVTWAGDVYCWGDNSEGQCGQPPAFSTFFHDPIPVIHYYEKARCARRHALQVACGGHHTACVTSDGGVWTWGSNACGQLGIIRRGPTNEWLELSDWYDPHFVFGDWPDGMHFAQLSCGNAHTVLLAQDGKIFAWGSNAFGQCAVPHAQAGPESPEPQQIVSLPRLVQDAQGVSRVAAGANFTVVAGRAGLLSWGNNTFGQLGRETSTPLDPVPARVELPYRLAPELEEAFKVCSPAEAGGGRAGGVLEAADFVAVEDLVEVEDLSCGDDHSVLALSDGSVWVWGRGTQAALGLGTQMKNVTRPVPLPASGDLKSVLLRGGGLRVVAGGANSALLSWGRGGGGRESLLYTWGANKCGELGHGDVTKRAVPRVVKMGGWGGGRGGKRGQVNNAGSLFALSLGGSHAVALAEWRNEVSSDRGRRAGGESWVGGRGSLSSSCSSDATSFSSSFCSVSPGSFGRAGWGGGGGSWGEVGEEGSARLARSFPDKGWGGWCGGGRSPPAKQQSPLSAERSSKGSKAVSADASTGAKAGGKAMKQTYSAGGGCNKREIRTPKKKDKKDKREVRVEQLLPRLAQEVEALELDGDGRREQQQMLVRRIRAFVAEEPAPEAVLCFEPCLSAFGRKVVHQVAESMGLIHATVEDENGRYITVRVPPGMKADLATGHERERGGRRSRGSRGGCRDAADVLGLGLGEGGEEWAAEAARYSAGGIEASFGSNFRLETLSPGSFASPAARKRRSRRASEP